MTAAEEYIVIGHINPVGSYPAYVIPVVSTESGDFALFLSERNSFDLQKISKFSRQSPTTFREAPSLVTQSREHRLFAFTEGNSFLYKKEEANEFWALAVNIERILETNPFAGLDIAIDTTNRSSIITALAACIVELRDRNSHTELVDIWYRSQLSELQRVLRTDLSLPERSDDLPTEVMRLPEAALSLVSLSTRTAAEALSRPGLDVRETNLGRRRGRTLIEVLLQRTAEICADRQQVAEWSAFFDLYVLRLQPATIAHRLSLEGAEAVASYAARAMSALRETVDVERANNPALRGLTGAYVQAAFQSPRIFVRPQGIDIVFCIDITGSMEPFIDAARRIVSNFHERLLNGLSLRGIAVAQVNARIVVFRDFLHDDEPMRQTSFMRLPQEDWAFRSIVNGLRPGGGGDDPESGLEAMAFALDSAWVSHGANSARVIMLFTDAQAHSFEETRAKQPKSYPSDLPHSLGELKQKWERFCSQSNVAVQRFVLFAPDVAPWSEIAREWPNTIHIISQAGVGLETVPDDLIVESIARGLE